MQNLSVFNKTSTIVLLGPGTTIVAKTNETPRLICCFVLFNPPPPLQCWLAKLKHEMMVFFAIDKPTQHNYSQCNINIVRGKGGGFPCINIFYSKLHLPKSNSSSRGLMQHLHFVRVKTPYKHTTKGKSNNW